MHTHVLLSGKNNWKEHRESNVVACAGREVAVFWGWKNVNATVLIVMMMPAGGLELKQLFAYKMVLVSGATSIMAMFGNGFSNLWVPLTASRNIVAAFYSIY